MAEWTPSGEGVMLGRLAYEEQRDPPRWRDEYDELLTDVAAWTPAEPPPPARSATD